MKTTKYDCNFNFPQQQTLETDNAAWCISVPFRVYSCSSMLGLHIVLQLTLQKRLLPVSACYHRKQVTDVNVLRVQANNRKHACENGQP